MNRGAPFFSLFSFDNVIIRHKVKHLVLPNYRSLLEPAGEVTPDTVKLLMSFTGVKKGLSTMSGPD